MTIGFTKNNIYDRLTSVGVYRAIIECMHTDPSNIGKVRMYIPRFKMRDAKLQMMCISPVGYEIEFKVLPWYKLWFPQRIQYTFYE